MTAPALTPESVEEFDLVPACEEHRHGEVRPPADVWLDEHGCRAVFSCAPCYERGRAAALRWLAIDGAVRCTVCNAHFHDIDEAITRVVKLR